MRVIRAEIVAHASEKGSRHSIYSIDCQPSGNRLATGGGDGMVKLWDMKALLSTPEEAQESLLATLTNHTKSVNTVRWSRDGTYLASASDDSYIIIYKHTPNRISNQSFGSKQVNNKEVWSSCFTCQGHTMDVLDIDWSPRGFLASASVDNTVMIWNPVSTYKSFSAIILSPIYTIKAHMSFVRGISYDITGKYLTTCGADNVLFIWDADDNYKESKKIRNPLKDSPDTTLFRRVSWSPDGLSFCLTSALKSNKPIGNIIKRKTWDCVADLVGHSSATSCCRFAPVMLQTQVTDTLVTTTPAPVLEPASPPPAQSAPHTPTSRGGGGRGVDTSIENMDIDNSISSDSVVSVEKGHQQQSAADMDIIESHSLSPLPTVETQTNRRSLRLSNVSTTAAATTGVAATVASKPKQDGDIDSISDTSSSSCSTPLSTLITSKKTINRSSKLTSIVALGDQVGVISLWGSHSNKALLVLKQVMTGPITDIAWHACDDRNVTFVCCGLDGNVVIFLVPLEQLGAADDATKTTLHSVAPAVFQDHIVKLYSRPIEAIITDAINKYTPPSNNQTVVSSSFVSSSVPLSNPSQQFSSAPRIPPSSAVFSSSLSNRMTAPGTSQSRSASSLMTMQSQNISMKNGRKRIQPILMQEDGHTIDHSYMESSQQPHNTAAAASNGGAKKRRVTISTSTAVSAPIVRKNQFICRILRNLLSKSSDPNRSITVPVKKGLSGAGSLNWYFHYKLSASALDKAIVGCELTLSTLATLSAADGGTAALVQPTSTTASTPAAATAVIAEAATGATVSSAAILAIQNQTATTKNGRKRIQPILMQEDGQTIDTTQSQPKPATVTTTAAVMEPVRVSMAVTTPTKSIPPSPMMKSADEPFISPLIGLELPTITSSTLPTVLPTILEAPLEPEPVPVAVPSSIEEPENHQKWKVSIGSEIVCIAGISTDPSTSQDGIVAVGCVDGTIQLLGMSDGLPCLDMAVQGNVVLGFPVAYVDIHIQQSVYYLVSMTVDGQIWHWGCEKSPSGGYQLMCINKITTENIINQLSFSLEATGATTTGGSDKDIHVTKCELDGQNRIRVTIQRSSAAGVKKTTSSYVYQTMSMTWMELQQQ